MKTRGLGIQFGFKKKKKKARAGEKGRNQKRT